jgi:hypothetical protein
MSKKTTPQAVANLAEQVVREGQEYLRSYMMLGSIAGRPLDPVHIENWKRLHGEALAARATLVRNGRALAADLDRLGANASVLRELCANVDGDGTYPATCRLWPKVRAFLEQAADRFRNSGSAEQPAPAADAQDKTADKAPVSAADLAKRHGLKSEALRKRLDRERTKNHDCFIEIDASERKPHDAGFLYRPEKVAHVIEAMKAKTSG